MRNVWVILRKELNSYFVSPVAYLLLAMFAIIFGFFFWNSLGYFVYMGMESQMRGQSFPMNVNEELIRPLLSNISVVGLFLIPMITMRLFAEEKRSGTIELLVTSPVTDIEVILGKWLAALVLYSGMLLLTAVNFGSVTISATAFNYTGDNDDMIGRSSDSWNGWTWSTPASTATSEFATAHPASLCTWIPSGAVVSEPSSRCRSTATIRSASTCSTFRPAGTAIRWRRRRRISQASASRWDTGAS